MLGIFFLTMGNFTREDLIFGNVFVPKTPAVREGIRLIMYNWLRINSCNLSMQASNKKGVNLDELLTEQTLIHPFNMVRRPGINIFKTSQHEQRK